MSGDAEPVDEAEAALDHDMDVAELPLSEFKLPPARELDENDREVIVQKAVTRIHEGAKDLVAYDTFDASDTLTAGIAPRELWMLVLIRMATRVSDPADGVDEENEDMRDDSAISDRSEIYERQDRMRHALVEYVMADFAGRYVYGDSWIIGLR